MSSTQTGRKAEAAAAMYLEMRGYSIIERNFRRPRCEIDVIASKDGVVYFVEVKYRRNDDQGGGFEAITATKLKQMKYASEIWVQETKWQGAFQLAAIELSGPDFSVLGFIDNVYF
ncbi:MAG: putative Ribonuclease [Candidatus Saccharibacteria bacterium]|nr:putative Ribonuclease [Candidatus Saccharibacteria bacterium]